MSQLSSPSALASSVRIPLAEILNQLPSGSVRFTFQQIKAAGEPEAFIKGTAFDSEWVGLPLAELLRQLRPDQLVRKTGQKRVHVPDEVKSVFSTGSRGTVPASEAGGTKESQPPAETPSADTPIRFPGRNASPPSTPPAATSANDPTRSITPDRAESAPTAPRLPTAAVPTGGASEAYVDVRVRDLAAHWPEAVRSLLESRLTPDAVVRLPVEEVEPGLKAGKVSMTWAKIRSYLIAAPEGLMTEWDDEKMALPLSVLAPLFLAQRRGSAEKARAVVPALAEQIPDVFAGPGANRLTDKGTGGATAPVAGSPKAGGSAQKYGAPLTPNAMVEEMARVAGVSGALLVSGDGLWIAASLPDGVGKEAVAALVPSIHQRLVDFCREVKGGALTKVLLQMGDRPVLLVPVDTNFLVVLGGVGKNMPEKEMMVFLQRLDRTPATR